MIKRLIMVCYLRKFIRCVSIHKKILSIISLSLSIKFGQKTIISFVDDFHKMFRLRISKARILPY
ncbi:hypothetical protein Hanom_Chr04g00357601 [Helianthus anomalus]